MADEIHIASKIAHWPETYPTQFRELRDRWYEFITNPSTDKDDYLAMINTMVAEVETADVDPGHRADLVVAAFWAASADSVFAERQTEAQNAAENVRDALDKVW